MRCADEQLGGAQHGHVAEQLRPDFVLAAVAAVVLHVDRPQSHAMREQREQRVVLVVGMRRGLHECSGDVEFAQRQAERDVAAVLRHQREIHAVLREDAKMARDRGQEHQRQRASAYQKTQQAFPGSASQIPNEHSFYYCRLSPGRKDRGRREGAGSPGVTIGT